jgi:hypothetical protein
MTRMVSFRVSEREFELLRSKSEALGARSVSDYARVALCGSSSPLDGQTEADFRHLSLGIQQLNSELRRLFDLLENPQKSFPAGQPASSNQNHNGGVGNL